MRSLRSQTLRPFWGITLAVALVFGAAACGGDDDAADASGDSGAAETSDADSSNDDGTDSDGGGNDAEAPTDGGGADVGASVTIDGVTYEATEELACLAMGDFIGGSFINDDGTIEISIDLAPEGEGPSGARVDDSSDPNDIIQWESGGDVVELNDEFRDVAQVGDYTIADRGATGTATFIDTTKLADGTATTVEGTFRLQCPEA